MAVKGANWRHPHGFDSTYTNYLNYPVVQMSHTDADEYCSWAGRLINYFLHHYPVLIFSFNFRRLPNEVEWEYAARGGLINETYPWGNEFQHSRLNIWEV
jgi:formylglycine-generating enzyme required for sulfatase activity